MIAVECNFDIGQELWTIKDHKAHQFKVKSAHVSVRKNADNETVSNVTYYAEGDDYLKNSFSQEHCFTTKEELLASL